MLTTLLQQDLEEALKKLPEDERRILEAQINIPNNSITFFTLFRYASRRDLLILLVSAICAMGAGAAMPLMTMYVLPASSESGVRTKMLTESAASLAT